MALQRQMRKVSTEDRKGGNFHMSEVPLQRHARCNETGIYLVYTFYRQRRYVQRSTALDRYLWYRSDF